MNTLGKLIVNSIKLMFDNVGAEITCNTQEEYNNLFANSNYARRLANIIPAINTGIQQTVKVRAFPQKVYVKNFGQSSYPKYLNLADEIDDFYRLDMISWHDINGTLRIENKPYMLSNTVLVLPVIDITDYADEDTDLEVAVTYTPKAPQFDLDYGLAVDMELPNEIFSALPYWIKSVLYEVDEPELAKQAKSVFYEMLEQEEKRQETTNYIDNVYDCEEVR